MGEIQPKHYNEALLDQDLVKSQIADPYFDDKYIIDTLDTTIIATVFGQFVDEGKIEKSAIPICKIAIQRQLLYNKLISRNPQLGSERNEILTILHQKLHLLEVHQSASNFDQ